MRPSSGTASIGRTERRRAKRASRTAALRTPRRRSPRSASCVRRCSSRRRRSQDDYRGRKLTDGNMDVYQWFLMISSHSQRHILQIREVKAAQGIPKPEDRTPDDHLIGTSSDFDRLPSTVGCASGRCSPDRPRGGRGSQRGGAARGAARRPAGEAAWACSRSGDLASGVDDPRAIGERPRTPRRPRRRTHASSRVTVVEPHVAASSAVDVAGAAARAGRTAHVPRRPHRHPNRRGWRRCRGARRRR